MSTDLQKTFEAGMAVFLRAQLSERDDGTTLSDRELRVAVEAADAALGFLRHCAQNGPLPENVRSNIHVFLDAIVDAWADLAPRGASTTTETLQ